MRRLSNLTHTPPPAILLPHSRLPRHKYDRLVTASTKQLWLVGTEGDRQGCKFVSGGTARTGDGQCRRARWFGVWRGTSAQFSSAGKCPPPAGRRLRLQGSSNARLSHPAFRAAVTFKFPAHQQPPDRGRMTGEQVDSPVSLLPFFFSIQRSTQRCRASYALQRCPEAP